MLLAQNFTAIENNAGLPAWNSLLSPGGWITKLLPYIFYGAGIALLVYVTVAGLQFMMSRGDPKGVAAAQAKLTYAVIGFVIIALAFSLVQLIGSIFGITAFSAIFK